jgi:predicted HicB family RNase H-like nuclease
MRKTQKKEERLHFGFTIPKELHKRLVDLAIQERRSLTDQIIYMLEKGLKKAA